MIQLGWQSSYEGIRFIKIEELEYCLDFKYTKIAVDVGYESEESYAFLKGNRQISFIKLVNHEISKSKNIRKIMVV